MIAAHLRKRRPKPHATWHLDDVYLMLVALGLDQLVENLGVDGAPEINHPPIDLGRCAGLVFRSVLPTAS
jgi:hypothetical protein